ncbi:monovalent cation/H+ antiporter complex subunit F [Desulfuromonas sp. KJ2020]|uniref:monovalent cation/H+ antiporter complex subunit F n=1 Tax=Desulfuromonas sp. KJ2020 TaxID=2919173 RepID=UPI0003222365|nr:monovalent cation/H+ antiporter complex subunit F [Desulfuromonas sp. KJ2020]MCP3176238.1 monovalent cation/H+ antiporter complex subunit F [Desulfuromonas sp. KJ2020]MDW7644718.1 monovalent cation/H+ antiporter complex subunit F [Desulfuromonadales bacterium]MDW7756061.1 monovalent cation/H+ antiporter complex subunit F [Desulfuromonadales bacterium]
MITHIVMAGAIFIIMLMALCLIRVVGGPTVLDRILGGSVIGTKTTVLLLLIGMMYGNVGMFVDIALAYALLNFIATLGATKYFLRRQTVHLDGES